MNNLSVTIIQTKLHWENKQKNLEMLSSKIAAVVEPTDLMVLPEMFSTGFSMTPEKLAEPMNGTTVEWMRLQAKEKNCVITGSFVAEDNGKYYNRMLWMNPDGSVSHYDKRHLFGMADEHKHYSAGQQKQLIKLKGWKVLPLVCYDLRFPVWSRNDAANPYDVVLYVANWPERRSAAWKTLLKARAIENQSYVVGVNRVGEDGNGISHSGDSTVINALGEEMSTMKAHEEKVETVILSKDDLITVREKLPFLQDGDRFIISE